MSPIDQIRETYGEWLEMVDNPYALIATVLEYKLIAQAEHIKYLERRLNHECVK